MTNDEHDQVCEYKKNCLILEQLNVELTYSNERLFRIIENLTSALCDKHQHKPEEWI